jgi:hypothetical protein
MLVDDDIIEELIAEINVRSSNQSIASIAGRIIFLIENQDFRLIDVSGLSPDSERILVKGVRFADSNYPK